MCLDKITKVYRPSLFNLWIPKFAYKSGVGWKYFYEEIYNLSSIYKGNNETLDMGKFLDEDNYRSTIYTNSKEIEVTVMKKYNFGWHILLEKPSKWYPSIVVKKVEYKLGHTLGIDETYKAPTIVAKYMKILED